MKIEQQGNNPKVYCVKITEANSGQRLDNFLFTLLKGVPKSRIYRIVRKGEVRVNKARCEAKQRLLSGDIIRIPPVRVARKVEQPYLPFHLQLSLEREILFEDEALLIINKPAGFAVHGGSGVDSGLIEALRQIRADAHFLELVHRLDKDTSGCLMIAKKRSVLRNLHELFRDTGVKKTYLALLAGKWDKKQILVNVPLQKNIHKGGERMVVVSRSGKSAETFFRRRQAFRETTLIEATPKTGRTHQIRVHAAWLGHPIVGDERYGQDELNRTFKKRGYKRLCLHAEQLEFVHPISHRLLSVSAPLPRDLDQLLNDEK